MRAPSAAFGTQYRTNQFEGRIAGAPGGISQAGLEGALNKNTPQGLL